MMSGERTPTVAEYFNRQLQYSIIKNFLFCSRGKTAFVLKAVFLCHKFRPDLESNTFSMRKWEK